MTERYKSSSHVVFNLNYHIIWCPKYRRKVLVGEVETRLKELLYEKSADIGVEIKSLEVMPDHVHIFISCPPTIAPHEVAGWLKGYTSMKLRKEMPALKSRLPTLWTRAYYIESVGHISEATIRKYIADQKKV
jgi:putative transposase